MSYSMNSCLIPVKKWAATLGGSSIANQVGCSGGLKYLSGAPITGPNGLVALGRFLIMTPFFEPGAPPASLIEQITC